LLHVEFGMQTGSEAQSGAVFVELQHLGFFVTLGTAFGAGCSTTDGGVAAPGPAGGAVSGAARLGFGVAVAVSSAVESDGCSDGGGVGEGSLHPDMLVATSPKTAALTLYDFLETVVGFIVEGLLAER
jgi:hypothetical protein